MHKLSRKQLNGLVHRMSNEIKGKMLAHAFKMLKSEGLVLRIAELDGEKLTFVNNEKDPRRINVQIVDGRVQRCWIG